MTTTTTTTNERAFVEKLLSHHRRLPRSVAKLLTAPAHRVGLTGPDTLPTGNGNMREVELAALAEFCFAVAMDHAHAHRETATKLYLKLHRRLTIAALRAGGQDA